MSRWQLGAQLQPLCANFVGEEKLKCAHAGSMLATQLHTRTNCPLLHTLQHALHCYVPTDSLLLTGSTATTAAAAAAAAAALQASCGR
jgi:hypothetical protein